MVSLSKLFIAKSDNLDSFLLLPSGYFQYDFNIVKRTIYMYDIGLKWPSIGNIIFFYCILCFFCTDIHVMFLLNVSLIQVPTI